MISNGIETHTGRPINLRILEFTVASTLMLFAGQAFAQTQPGQSGQSPPQQPPANSPPSTNDSSSHKTSSPGQSAEPEPAPNDKSKSQSNNQSANYNPFPAVKDVEVGEFYMHKGDLDAAISRFEEAIQLRPNFAQPRLLLAQIYEKKGENDLAVKFYKEYLQIYPHAPDAKKIEKKIEKLSKEQSQ